MSNRVVLAPYGRRGLKGDVGPQGDGVTTLEPRIDGIEASRNMGGMVGVYDGFARVSRAADATDPDDRGLDVVCLVGGGDSMAHPDNYTVGGVIKSLQLLYGSGGVMSPGFGASDEDAVNGWDLVGATQPRNKFDYLPGANQIHMPAGSTAAMTLDKVKLSSDYMKNAALNNSVNEISPALDVKQVEVYYLTRPGDGSLSIVVNGGTPVVVNCNGALDLKRVVIPITDPTDAIDILVTASTAECLLIGVLFKRKRGVIGLSAQVGGSSMTAQNAYINNGNINTLYKKLCEFLGVILIIHHQRAALPVVPDLEAQYEVLFAGLKSAMPLVSQLVLTELPYGAAISQATKDASLAANVILRDKAREHNLGFFDLYTACGGADVDFDALGFFTPAEAVHGVGAGHRFWSTLILSHFNWFKPSFSQRNVTVTDFTQSRANLLAFDRTLTRSFICGGSFHTVDSSDFSGVGYEYIPQQLRGYKLNAGAATGHAAIRIGPAGDRTVISTDQQSSVYTVSGYRCLDLVSHHRAFIAFGATATITTLTGLTEECFGIEFAFSADVGESGADESMRLFFCDGSTNTYSRWIPVAGAGQGSAQGYGMYATLLWSKEDGRFYLYRSNATNAHQLALVLDASFFQTTNAGAHIVMGVEDDGTAPADTSTFSFHTITATQLVNLPDPFDS